MKTAQIMLETFTSIHDPAMLVALICLAALGIAGMALYVVIQALKCTGR